MKNLQQLLTQEVVSLGQPVDNWEHGIRLAGKLLLDQGSITQDYIENSVKAAVEMGAYFVVCPGVAISHARPGEGVNQVCLSMVTFQTPVVFGHPSNDPVELLFMFATLDDQSHLDLLRNVSKLLCDEDLVGKVMKAQSHKELVELLEGCA